MTEFLRVLLLRRFDARFRNPLTRRRQVTFAANRQLLNRER